LSEGLVPTNKHAEIDFRSWSLAWYREKIMAGSMGVSLPSVSDGCLLLGGDWQRYPHSRPVLLIFSLGHEGLLLTREC